MPDSLTENNLFFLTAALSRKLTHQADKTFATVGLSSSHALLLYVIHENPQIQPSHLAERLYLKPSTITRLVQKLERRGLVEKQSEGRSTAIVCTDKGVNMAAEMQKKWEDLIHQKQQELGERYVEVLSEMISNALDEMEKE